jgi:Cd2+/Zn2+-exporting ATPase
MKTYTVQGMDCAECARTIEKGVSRLEGVRSVQVDFAAGKMQVEGDAAPEAIRERVEALGYRIVGVGARRAAPLQTSHTNGLIGFWRYLLARWETRLAVIGGAMILVGLALALLLSGRTDGLASTVIEGLYIVAMLVALYPIARSGVNNLRINHDFNINLLMSIAAIGAVFIGETLEAATVIFLFAIGEALEGYTADRARSSLRSLMELAPAQATRIRRAEFVSGDNFISLGEIDTAGRGDLPGRPYTEEVVPVEALAIGDTILVEPGERVAMDGVVTAGESGVNQAPITGESIPVHKATGAEVYAGTINGSGALEVRVTRLAADNTLSRIIQLIEAAQSVRAPSQRLIDRFAHYYTPAVVVVALLVAIIPPLVFNAPFYDTPDGRGWLYRALALLVIACPCALVISTPVTVISAITAAARRGVLIKGGAHLEALGRVRAFAFDKTGTLTTGQPVVTVTRSIDCETGEPCAQCDDVLALAAAVERRSAHPLAKAVMNAAQSRGLAETYAPADSVEMLAGRGVQGRVNDKLVTVGNHNLFDAEHPHSADLCALIEAAEAQGQTSMLLCDGDRVRGFIAVADRARADSQQVVSDLKALGNTTVMLTGDNAAVAQAIGRAVGVDDVRAGLLPADKVDAVKGLMNAYGSVAMVGDGVNDTPALAAATVGIAMGGAGSAQALETADIALMADDLRQLPFAVRLSRFARRLIVQNIALSLGMKAAFMLLALAGGASLWMAILADVGMSLVVTLNGMRPLRLR